MVTTDPLLKVAIHMLLHYTTGREIIPKILKTHSKGLQRFDSTVVIIIFY